VQFCAGARQAGGVDGVAGGMAAAITMAAMRWISFMGCFSFVGASDDDAV
jgi:hypothetical protein